MLVHSYIYYELNDNIIPDSKWAEWAKELAQLQQDYPKESEEEEFYDMFRDWDGSSGAFLNFGENIKTVAKILLGIKSPSQHMSSEVKKRVKTISVPKSKIKSNTRSLF